MTYIVYSERKQTHGPGMLRFVAGLYEAETSARAAAEALNASAPQSPMHFDWVAESQSKCLHIQQ